MSGVPEIGELEPVFTNVPSGTGLCLTFFLEEMHDEAHRAVDTVS